MASKGQVAGITDLHEAHNGLPDPSQLGVLPRIVMEGSALSDLALRTAASTLIAATAVPFGFSPRRLRRERDELEFYRDLAERRDPPAPFPRPAGRAGTRAGPAP